MANSRARRVIASSPIASQRDLRPDRIARREELPCKMAIDQGFADAFTASGFERSACEDPHSHHFDVVGADTYDIDGR
jgi:hypothetical protein